MKFATWLDKKRHERRNKKHGIYTDKPPVMPLDRFVDPYDRPEDSNQKGSVDGD